MVDQAQNAQPIQQVGSLPHSSLYSDPISDDFTLWLRRFQFLATLRNYNEDQCKSLLAASVSGSASYLVQDLDPNHFDTYAEMVEAYRERFLPAANLDTARSQLEQAKQNPGENVLFFHARVRSLHTRAYPGVVEHEMKIRIFKQGIFHREVKNAVIRAQPQTYNDALAAAQIEEEIVNMYLPQTQVTPTVPKPLSSSATASYFPAYHTWPQNQAAAIPAPAQVFPQQNPFAQIQQQNVQEHVPMEIDALTRARANAAAIQAMTSNAARTGSSNVARCYACNSTNHIQRDCNLWKSAMQNAMSVVGRNQSFQRPNYSYQRPQSYQRQGPYRGSYGHNNYGQNTTWRSSQPRWNTSQRYPTSRAPMMSRNFQRGRTQRSFIGALADSFAELATTQEDQQSGADTPANDPQEDQFQEQREVVEEPYIQEEFVDDYCQDF